MIPRRKKDIVLRVAPPPGEGNVLSAYLEEHRRWLDAAHVMAWLAQAHPGLVKGVLLARDMDATDASKALVLVRARLGQQRRWRGR